MGCKAKECVNCKLSTGVPSEIMLESKLPSSTMIISGDKLIQIGLSPTNSDHLG